MSQILNLASTMGRRQQFPQLGFDRGPRSRVPPGHTAPCDTILVRTKLVTPYLAVRYNTRTKPVTPYHTRVTPYLTVQYHAMVTPATHPSHHPTHPAAATMHYIFLLAVDVRSSARCGFASVANIYRAHLGSEDTHAGAPECDDRPRRNQCSI